MFLAKVKFKDNFSKVKYKKFEEMLGKQSLLKKALSKIQRSAEVFQSRSQPLTPKNYQSKLLLRKQQAVLH